MNDDLEDFKLETSFDREDDCTIHTSWTQDRARGLRKVKVEDRWHRKQEIGVGSFGTVYLEAKDNGQQRATKAVRKKLAQKFGVDYKRELAALTFFSRSKYRQYQIFVEFLGLFEDDNFMFLAMEYFPQGDLSMYYDKIKERDAKVISHQILEGLQIMHEKGFTHRDLKPQNIFIVQLTPTWWIKIGDFGITKRIKEGESTELRTATGTCGYEAPEIRGLVDDANLESSVYTNAVDIWPFGCVVYKMIARNVPFQSSRDLKRFCDNRLSFPTSVLADRMSAEGVNFLGSLLKPKYLDRPTAATALQHDWLKPDEILEVLDADPIPKSAGATLTLVQKLIIGIDWHADFTVVSYGRLGHSRWDDINVLPNWPDQSRGNGGSLGEPSQIYSPHNSLPAIKNWDSDSIPELIPRSESCFGLDKRRTMASTALCGEFLKKLRSFITTIIDYHPKTQIHYWFTVTAFWSVTTRSAFKSAVIKAGSAQEQSECISLIGDVEASAWAGLIWGLNEHLIKSVIPRDAMLVCKFEEWYVDVAGYALSSNLLWVDLEEIFPVAASNTGFAAIRNAMISYIEHHFRQVFAALPLNERAFGS